MLTSNDLFKKINFDFLDIDPEELRDIPIQKYGRLAYYSIKNLGYLSSKTKHPICEIEPDFIFLAEITGSGHLSPHRDHGVMCCLNYYFETNDAVTHFYEPKSGSSAQVFPGKSTANIYSLDSVNHLGQFKAEKKDCYLLNVKEIHSVESTSPGTRRFITWQWNNHSFDVISKHLM